MLTAKFKIKSKVLQVAPPTQALVSVFTQVINWDDSLANARFFFGKINRLREPGVGDWYQSALFAAPGLRSVHIVQIQLNAFPTGIPQNWQNLNYPILLPIANHLLNHCHNLVALSSKCPPCEKFRLRLYSPIFFSSSSQIPIA